MNIFPDEPSLPVPAVALRDGGITLRFSRIVFVEPGKGLVPFYHFRMEQHDGTDVGHLNFKVGNTEHVRLYAGHLGYEVREDFRGRRYAFHGVRAAVPWILKLYGTVILTCDPDNIASRKTIERLGARFLEEAKIPPGDPAYLGGSRRRLRYEWTVT